MGFETLNLKYCELNLTELTVRRRVSAEGGLVSAHRFGGSQTYLEEDAHQQVGSADPIPITMYNSTHAPSVQARVADLARGYLLVGARARQCMRGSI